MLLAHAAAIGLFSLLGAQTPAVPPQAETTPPVSLTRIRAALKNPGASRLAAPLTRADFTVDILEKQRFEDLLTLLGLGGGSPMPTVLFGGAASHPSSAVDLFSIKDPKAKIVAARRARAERLARDEVRRALVAFCAATECPPQKP